VDIVNVVDAGYAGVGGETSFMVVHSSAEAFVGVVNPPAMDLSLMPSASYVGKAEQMAQGALSQVENIIVGNASALNSDTVQVMENTGQMTSQVIQNCSRFCGVAAALSATATSLKVGLQMTGESIANGATQATDFLLSPGMGSVAGMAAIYGGVTLCDNTLD